MLHIHHSNRLEILFESLAILQDRPLDNPLAAEVVVAQNPGMARWLSMQLAQRHGIAANLRFPLPAAFIWEVYRSHFHELPEQHPFERDVLAWRILSVLDTLLPQDDFAPLRHYLGDDSQSPASERRRHQLASRIADLFDQYLVYRPDWILAWEAGEEQQWQAQLWRAIIPTGSPHRARLLERFGAVLERGEVDPALLPERLFIFGIAALPPAYLALFDQLSQLIEVHLFILNPCRTFWSDIQSEVDQARIRQRWERSGTAESLDYFEQGNALLASLGKLGRDYQRLLHERDKHDIELYAAPEADTLLAQLQRDILDLHQPGMGEEPTHQCQADGSIQLHACHTPMREVQVLHDQLLALFEANPDLTPADVVVMTPEIDRYAPYIEAQFGSSEGAERIPWSIADRSSQAEQPIIQLFLQLLDLPTARFTQSEVNALLEVPALQARFGLDEGAVERLRQWMHESGIRWGVDGAKGDGTQRFSWRFGLDRLFLGYALPAKTELFAGIAPYPQVEGGEAALLGALQSLIDTLVRYRTRLRGRHTPSQWQAILGELLDELLLVEEADYPILQLLRDLVEGWAEAAAVGGFDQPMGLTPLRDALNAQLSSSYASQRFLTGQVTFCAMVPMRSLPFRVVCLLGMNDGDFPRITRPPAFDLIAALPRPGDRSRREDDRYLFLEALLSARDTLYLSYLGRSVRDNVERIPSLVVSELLDYLEQGYRDEEGCPLRDQLLTEHPLQPFSPDYFNASELFSYASHWQQAAQALLGPRQAVRPFYHTPLDPPDEREVELSELIRFFAHPVRHFVTRRLQLPLAQEAHSAEDHEPFSLGHIERYTLREDLLDEALDGAELSEREALHRARGVLPEAAFGSLLYAEEEQQTQAFVERLTPYLDPPQPAVELDFSHAGMRLTGWIDGLGEQGCLSYRRAKLKWSDVIGLWLRHLALSVSNGGAHQSSHIGEDVALTLGPVAAERAAELLGELLELWWQGQCEPIPLPPRATLGCIELLYLQDKEEGAALDKAALIWHGNDYIGAEASDPALQQLYRGEFSFDADYLALVQRICTPLFNHAEREE